MFLRILSLWALLTIGAKVECFPHRTSTSHEAALAAQKFEMMPGHVFLEAEEDDLEAPIRREQNSILKENVQTYPGDRQSSNYHDEERSEDAFAVASKRSLKRRKGPTLSVVNPLEILRQRLMLDLARRRIHENQQQISANADFLESLGKRSGKADDRRDNIFQR